MASWDRYLVSEKSDADLSRYDPDETGDFPDKENAKLELKLCRKKLAQLQDVLYAESKHALLVILQALDAGGKDGTIRHIFHGVNPQGCTATTFKVPTPEELKHDFLWRVHKVVPALGMIGIFNRSHYEEVLVVRVHENLSKEQLNTRFRHINDFERLLAESSVTILKFYLHISKEEQRRRLQKRLEDPRRRWKVTENDFKERRYWSAYQKAYEDVFRNCSTRYSPWYVIPANKKWFRNVTISQIIVHTLEQMKLKYPEPALVNPPDFK
jgi:PPK2 family polyphosphate:nucleotide phosphotransferase